MKYIKEWFNSTSLKNKLLYIILFNVIIILSFSISGYYLCTKVYNELLFKAIAGNLSISSYSISERLQNIENLSSIIISSPIVQEQLCILTESDNAIARTNANKALSSTLSSHYDTFQSDGVAYITLYNNQFSNCTNWALLSKTDSRMIDIANTNADQNAGAITWNYRSSDDYLLLTRNVLRIDDFSFSKIGSVLIAVDLNQIVTNTTQPISLYDNSQYIIKDKDNQVFFASNGLSTDEIIYFSLNTVQPYQTLSLNGHTYFTVAGTLPQYDYQYISLIPFDSIANSLKQILITSVFGLLLGFVLIAFFSSQLVHYIVNQFNALITKMQLFREDELPLPIEENPYSRRTDELGILHRQFDAMANRIVTLVNVNYVNEILTKDARLKSLEAQINPHFLYNTLESINSIAKMSGNSTICRMVSALGKVLRSTLANRQSLVSLPYELELIEDYMTIQKIRFEERLIYKITIDSNLNDAVIPPLTIQPLVENAIHYGMEEMTDECHVEINASLNQSLVTICVKNEGSYFEEGLLNKLKTKSKKPNGFGIGLINIDQRIKILFGDQYGLTLYNQDSYAIASITIPYQNGGSINVQTDYS